MSEAWKSVIKFFQFRTNKQVVCLLKIGILCFLAATSLLIWSLFWSFQTFSLLKKANFFQAHHASQLALPPVQFFSFLTFRQSTEIELWKTSLEEVQNLQTLQTSFQQYLRLALQNEPNLSEATHSIQEQIDTNVTEIQRLYTLSKNSFYFKKLILPKLPKTFRELYSSQTSWQSTLTQYQLAINHFFNKKIRYILLFQNVDELRATGGFMGSYAVLESNNGALQPIQFYDIYDADGQITTSTPAPPGVDEFLSGGQGLRLPNANWNPDFPSAAQDILHFFALSGQNSFDGVIVINSTFIKDLLQITGPIQLDTTQTVVTADTVSELARADRAQYFPGSKQKKSFLSSLSTQLRIKLQQLSSTQQMQLFQILRTNIVEKNIQAFSHDSATQAVFKMMGADGEVSATALSSTSDSNQDISPPAYFFSVESNVGINKANKNIERAVALSFDDKTLKVTIEFNNRNPKKALQLTEVAQKNQTAVTENPHDDYINYQRILLPTGSKLLDLFQDGKSIEKIDRNEVKTAAGEQLTQFGFLVPVAELSKSTLNFTVQLPNSFQLNSKAIIQKQSGLPATPYTVVSQGKIKNIILEHDEVVQFP